MQKTNVNILHNILRRFIGWLYTAYGHYAIWAFSLQSGRKKKIPFGRAIGWDGGSGMPYCVFLLTFNSPKHPCFTASWAIAFLNLSLERQELWSLSIEEKGMLFPCHLLVVPPSSPVLIYGPTPHHPHLTSIPLLFATLVCRKLQAKSCYWMPKWGWWKNVQGEGGGGAHIGLELLLAAPIL